MTGMPASVEPALRRLARRLALGLFLDVWPMWGAVSLLLGGLIALVCRLFFADAASSLHWLWMAPLLTAVPAFIACFMRAYGPAEVVALADRLGGGQGILLALHETNDPAWIESPILGNASRFALPRLRPWRRLAALVPAVVFLAAALMLPQRMTTPAATAALADEVVADLTATLKKVKQQDLITPVEEKKLEEEIERLRHGAQRRVDSSSWEAADALHEQVVAGLAGKQDAVKWAADSLARYAAAAQAGANGGAPSEPDSVEVMKAFEKLAQSGLLAGAPADVLAVLKSGKLPKDTASLRELQASLSRYLAETNGRFRDLARLGKEFGRFNPSEFPLACDKPGAAEGANPGRGGVDRGRADAPLTWGNESLPFDRFKAHALPPGAARSPDDWAPVAALPGAPRESPGTSGGSIARQYAAAAGQTAWRRSLAPRHQSAVKKYFDR